VTAQAVQQRLQKINFDSQHFRALISGGEEAVAYTVLIDANMKLV
jgi:hypothetical protein